MINTGKLAGRTLFVTGASRGIGKAIALKAARDGANVVVAAKTAEPHPKLPGTIYSAAEEIEAAGGRALPCIVDVRDEQQIKSAVQQAVDKFGGIDILINNASAISLTPTLKTDMKRYDLMHSVNTRGTFLVSRECLPHLLRSEHAHILNLSPPLNLAPHWFGPHVAYTMAKYGMSMCVLGMAEEFRDRGIGVNALWPRTVIATAAMEMIGGAESSTYSRNVDIMADAAYGILCRDPRRTTGQFFIDEDVVREAGVQDLRAYACDPANADHLMPDFFLDVEPAELAKWSKKLAAGAAGPATAAGQSNIERVFQSIERNLSEQLVGKTQATFLFNVTGTPSGDQQWFVDLKSGAGRCGAGKPPGGADATLTMRAGDFDDLFAGKLNASGAFMSGKLKISGDLSKAMKLEKLMKSLRAKV